MGLGLFLFQFESCGKKVRLLLSRSAQITRLCGSEVFSDGAVHLVSSSHLICYVLRVLRINYYYYYYCYYHYYYGYLLWVIPFGKFRSPYLGPLGVPDKE